MALAAAVGDRAALRQGGGAVEEVRRTLTQLHTLREVLGALDRLYSLVARPVLTDRDVGAIRALVQDLQGMLSE